MFHETIAEAVRTAKIADQDDSRAHCPKTNDCWLAFGHYVPCMTKAEVDEWDRLIEAGENWVVT